MKIKNLYTGIECDYVPWDEEASWSGRMFHACPVCGIGVTSKVGGPFMAHLHCIEKVKKEREAATASN